MEWTIDLILKGTVVLLAAYLLAMEGSRISAAVRDAVWTIAFGALLVMPVLSLVTPEWRGPVKIDYAIEAVAGPARPMAGGVPWLGWLWLAGFVVLVGRLALAHLQAARLTGLTVQGENEAGIQVVRTPAGTMPMTWGFRRPVILMPADADEWAWEIRESVMRHELAHVRRGDLWRQLLTQATCCVWWFHPLAWMAAKRASRAREQACDDAVLSRGTKGEQYAEHLIAVARSRRTLAAAASLPFGSQLENRILAVLDRTAVRSPVSARSAGIAALAAAIMLLPFAGMRLWAEEVQRIGDGVQAPTLILKVEPQYTEQARDAGVQGKVVLYAEVTKEGLPDNVSVEEGLDDGLDANAITAVRQWRFEPAMKDGKPVRVSATIEVNFRLQ